MKKKIWQTPKLTVLVRSKPEEVLQSDCKAGRLTTGPYNNSQGCGDVAQTNCGACQGRGGGNS